MREQDRHTIHFLVLHLLVESHWGATVREGKAKARILEFHLGFTHEWHGYKHMVLSCTALGARLAVDQPEHCLMHMGFQQSTWRLNLLYHKTDLKVAHLLISFTYIFCYFLVKIERKQNKANEWGLDVDNGKYNNYDATVQK